MTKNISLQHWLTQDYKEEEVYRTTQHLRNNKSHGPDGIPGEAYKALAPYIAEKSTSILSRVKNGESLPTRVGEGAIVHIYNEFAK